MAIRRMEFAFGPITAAFRFGIKAFPQCEQGAGTTDRRPGMKKGTRDRRPIFILLHEP